MTDWFCQNLIMFKPVTVMGYRFYRQSDYVFVCEYGDYIWCAVSPELLLPMFSHALMCYNLQAEDIFHADLWR